MKIISYTDIFFDVNRKLTQEDYEAYDEYVIHLDKSRKFKSCLELGNYIKDCFNEDRYIIEYYANSPNYILLAKDNILYKIELTKIKDMDKYLLDKLLFDKGLISDRKYINQEESISSNKTITFNGELR